MKILHHRTCKVFVAICILIFSTGYSHAQCDNAVIKLDQQFLIDDFKDIYGCTVIPGRLEITGPDITNLHGLEDIVQIGTLTIYQTSLTNLTGFEKLVKVDDIIIISNNDNLATLQGLEGLEETGGLNIYNNNNLTDISGLINLKKTIALNPEDQLSGRVYFEENPALHTLSGLNNLSFIDGELIIKEMHGLLGLTGLSQLDSIRSILTITDNNFLQNLTGLEDLAKAEQILIYQNTSLLSLEGLRNLSKVPLGVLIDFNPALESIGNLENLKVVGHIFKIAFSPKLRSLQGLSIESIINPIDEYGGLSFLNVGIKDFMGLEKLTRIEGNFYNYNNDTLKTLSGLENLRTITGDLEIVDNDKLINIDGIEGLELIGGDLKIIINPQLSNCSIESVCRYLNVPSGFIGIYSNGPGCDEEEVLANCSPISELNLIDANLSIAGNSVSDIKTLQPEELLMLENLRSAVATDGISKVLIAIKTHSQGQIKIDEANDDGFEFPWGDVSHLIEGEHNIFLLYTAPEEFDKTQSLFMYEGAVEAYNKNIFYEFTSGTDVRINEFTITHVRPPVVLMHGTYSDPEQAWRTSAAGGSSMYDRLVGEGFKVFTVDYKESNGSPNILGDFSSFEHNARVLWGDEYPSNKGGIKDALSYYREELAVAATQADVVGHSLGGVLPRVYASNQYNEFYKRPENFMMGDINRLITLGSTHFGSDLADLRIFIDNQSPFEIGLLDWLVVESVNQIADIVGGASPSNAVIDQRPLPHGTAINSIGPTPIPSHAITFSVPPGALKDPIFDPDESYFDMYWYITTLLYQVHDLRTAYLERKVELSNMGLQVDSMINGGDPSKLYEFYTNTMLYKSMIEDAIHRAGVLTSVLDGSFELPSDIEIFKYALGETGMSNYADPLLDIFVAGADPVGVALDYFLPDVQFPTVQSILEDQLKVRESSMEALRSVIFNNDENDGVVRIQSQRGDIEKTCSACVTHFNNVLHGFAPRYSQVQERVVELLRNGSEQFNPNGFPATDQPQPIYFPPQKLDLFKVPVSGAAAICQSGIAPAHARAFAHIADKKDVIFITRPVNPDATDLIIQDAATKGMNVKPKSSNWGPQKGYLPVKQRYSKIWKVFRGEERDKKIAQYDSLANVDIAHGIAVPRELIITGCYEKYKVYIDENKIEGSEDAIAEDEVVVVPLQDPTKVCKWGEDYQANEIIDDCEPLSDAHQLVPLMVMASPQVLEDDGITPRYLTADYDLLMVGFNRGPDLGDPAPPELPFKPDVGQITPEQETLLNDLNAAVQATGYKGGKVVHHGPENQFDKSPYIDYPLTVFAPDHIPNGIFNQSTDGLILSIESGPPGRRDENLKLFVNRMRKEGYDLYHNKSAPGWQWYWDTDAKAYRLEDSRFLPDYIEQLPKNECDKFGGRQKDNCVGTLNPDQSSDEKHGNALKGNFNSTDVVRLSVSPTIIYNESVTLSVDQMNPISFSWMIVDAFGNVCEKGKINDHQKKIDISIDISRLSPGMYNVVTDAYGQVGRIIKM